MVCNSGTSLVPVVDGRLHHFNYVGIYDGLAVIQDKESKTLWNHVTGDAMYGPLVGRTLKRASNLLPMNVRQALTVDPKIRIAISDREYFAGGNTSDLRPASWAVAALSAGRPGIRTRNWFPRSFRPSGGRTQGVRVWTSGLECGPLRRAGTIRWSYCAGAAARSSIRSMAGACWSTSSRKQRHRRRCS